MFNYHIKFVVLKNILLGFFLLATIHSLSGQTEILKSKGSWFTFSNKIVISNKFYIVNAFQQRRVDFVDNTEGFFLTPSLNYKLTRNISIGGGYIYYKGFPNGVSYRPIHWVENTFFQHVTVSSNADKINIIQRFMFEERTIDLINTKVTPNVINGNKYVSRFRYRLQISFNMLKLKNDKFIIGKLSNETRIRFSDGVSNPDFDQNNFAVLLGCQLLKNSSVWMGYGRYYCKINSSQYVANNLLHLNLSYNIDLRKKK
ncbi:MAG: hypothetical protein COB01_02120 [Lutibacter sp.]|nr:MAG: hypothetical protein COB01_02120 [Lutibacter sp.]